jgi:hypothetical protein
MKKSTKRKSIKRKLTKRSIKRKNPDFSNVRDELLIYLRANRKQYVGEQDDPEMFMFISELIKNIDKFKKWDEITLDDVTTMILAKSFVLRGMEDIINKYTGDSDY